MSHGLPGARRRPALFAVIALGLVLAAPAARAQTTGTAPAAAKSDDPAPGDPDAVVIHGQRRHPSRTYGVPPDKAAAYGKQTAWRDYRDSTPSPTPGACPIPPDPSQGVGCGTLEGSTDYPGLRNVGQ